MARYFLDSCALAKRYVAEPGQIWVQNLCTDGNTIHISQLATVEVVRAIRKNAAPDIDRAHGRRKQAFVSARDVLIQEFQDHCHPVNGDYVIHALTSHVIAKAIWLVTQPGIRTLDAIQLASALLLQDYVTSNGEAPLAFVTANKDLLRHAQRYLTRLDNPENYRDPSEVVLTRNDWRAKLEQATRRLYEFGMRLNRGH